MDFSRIITMFVVPCYLPVIPAAIQYIRRNYAIHRVVRFEIQVHDAIRKLARRVSCHFLTQPPLACNAGRRLPDSYRSRQLQRRTAFTKAAVKIISAIRTTSTLPVVAISLLRSYSHAILCNSSVLLFLSVTSGPHVRTSIHLQEEEQTPLTFRSAASPSEPPIS